MRKVLLITLLTVLSWIPTRLYSLDLKLTAGLGNLSFKHDRTSALSVVDGKFQPYYFPMALAQLSGEFGSFSYNLGFERDPLLRNRLYANFRMDREYFFLEAGPVFGLFNSPKMFVNPGASLGMGLAIPGIIFIQASGSSTLGILMETTGNNFQRTGDLGAGFWVPHVICSFNLSYQNFALREKANLLIEDELIRYYFRSNVYTKNIPYTISLDIGYQSLRRSYTSQTVSGGTDIIKTTDKDEFKSIFMDIEGTYTLNPDIKLLLGAEIPIYSWGVRPLKDPSKSTFFFKVWTGVIWTLPARN